jgi:L-asparagine transporter-like permease
MNAAPELLKRLYQRQLNMIAIGGVIGAGLFIGSSVVLSTAGPGAFLTSAITVVLIILMMRMLGEMATASPSRRSFADLARRAPRGCAGFAVSWLYWYFWVIVVGFEAVSIARDHSVRCLFTLSSLWRSNHEEQDCPQKTRGRAQMDPFRRLAGRRRGYAGRL